MIVGVEPGTTKIKDEPLDEDIKPPKVPSPANKEPQRQPATVKSVVVKMSGPLSKTSQQARLNHPVAPRKRFPGQANDSEAGPSKKTKFTSVQAPVSGLAGKQVAGRRGKDKVVLMKSKRIVVVKPDSLGVRPSGPYSTGPTLSYSYATSTANSFTHTRTPKTSHRKNASLNKNQWTAAMQLPPTSHTQSQADFVVIRPGDLGMSTGGSYHQKIVPSNHQVSSVPHDTQQPQQEEPQQKQQQPTESIGDASFEDAFEQPNSTHSGMPPGVEPLRPKQEPVDENVVSGDGNPKDPTFTLTQL